MVEDETLKTQNWFWLGNDIHQKRIKTLAVLHWEEG